MIYECLLNPQGGCIKIGAYRLSSRQFWQFSGDNSYYGGNELVTNVLTGFACGEYWHTQIICEVLTQKTGLECCR